MSKSKKLKLFSCVALLVGAMFGSAIFSLSGLTIFEAGPSSLLSWIIAAPIMLIYGLLMAELASFYPKSGGVYVFPARAIKGKKGEFWGWISCWGYILGNFAAVAFSAIFVGVYLSLFIPGTESFQVPIAIASMIVVLILNVIKIKDAGIVNNIFVVALLVIMTLFVVIAITNQSFQIENLDNFFSQGRSGNFACISMVPICLVAYGAIVAIAFMANDVENPNKTIPKASIIAVCITASIYVLILFATLGVVTSQYLEANPDVLMAPIFAACANLVNGKWLMPFVSIASVIALVTTMNVLVSVNARAIQAAAEDIILPKAFAASNKNNQPIVAVIITVVICSVISCFPTYVSEIVNLGVLFNVLTIFITVIALVIARKNSKFPKGGFKLKGGNFVPYAFLLVLLICNISNVITSDLLMVCIYTLVLLAVGIIIFFISKSRR